MSGGSGGSCELEDGGSGEGYAYSVWDDGFIDFIPRMLPFRTRLVEPRDLFKKKTNMGVSTYVSQMLSVGWKEQR